jgi:hypothetical protein
MRNEMVREIDSKAMAEFCEDQEMMEAKPGKPQIQSCAEIFKRYVPEFDRQEKMSEVTKNSLGQVNDSTVEKSPATKTGLGSWIKDNPIQSLLIGALIGGGIYALYKHYNKEEKTETRNKSKKGKEKKKSKSLKELWEEKKIENENPPFDRDEDVEEEELNAVQANESSYSDEKTASISRKNLGIGITAAIGGSIIGAALGDASLIAGFPLAIAGIYKSNLGLALAGAGMALANGYKNGKEKNNESIIMKAFERVKNYLSNLFQNLFGLFMPEEKPEPGSVRTMLGYVKPNVYQPINNEG